MDASPRRKRKSVKGRRRSLRNLQPADLVESHNDLPAKNQQLYGSIWLDQAETPPISVTKPRRRSSVSNAQLSHHLNKENVFKPLEKGTFTPKSTLPKSVEIAPERTPVLCPVKSSDYFIKNAWNNENDPEEIRVAHFWQRDQDASLSTESFKKTVDILATDEKHTKHQNEIINHSIKDELQLSVDFSKKEQNETNLSKRSLSPDQLTAEPFIELVTSFMEPVASLSKDYFSESLHSCSGSTNNLDDNFPSLASPSETSIHHSCFPIFSGKQISSIPQKDPSRFSPDLCQDFQQLDISKNICTENDLQGNILNEGFRAINQNSHESLPASDSSLLDNDFSLNKAFSQTLNSSYSNDMSSLNESTLSESLDLWETDLSSAGSELSDSWCFSRHFNSANDFDSTPCKVDNSKMTPKIDKDYFVESEKNLIFSPEDKIKKIYPETVASSSVCTPTKEEENMPAIEHLSLDDHFPSDLNREPQTLMHEKSRIEGTEFCVTPNDESIKILPSENFQKNLTRKIPDSKIPKLKLSGKGVFLSTLTKKTISDSNKSSSNCSSLNSVDNNSFKRVTKLSSTKTIKQTATVNIKKSDKYSNDANKLKSTRLNKNLNGEKSLTLGEQDSYEQSENKSRNAIQVEKTKSKFQQKAVSPDVLIFDSLKRSPQINITQTMKSKTETAKNANQLSNRSSSVKKQCPLKKTSKSLPTVKMPHEDRNLNQSPQHTTYQQEDNQPVIVSTTDEVPIKAYFIKTLSEEKWLKGSNASAALDQTSGVTTTVAETSKLLPTVKTPCEDRNLNQSPRHMTYQQEDSQPAIISTDVVPGKAYFVETLSEEKWLKGSNASAEQISGVATTAAETNRCSQNSYSTSNVTLKRRNTKVKKKSINTTCDAEAQPDFGSEKNIIVSQTSSQCTKLKLKSLPILETADVAVVDLKSSVSSDGDDIFNRPVAKTVKRRCQSIGSVYFSIDQSLFNDDEEAMFPSTNVAVSHEDNKESTIKDREADSVGLREKSLEMLIDSATESPHLTLVNDVTPKKPKKPARTKRKSTGSIPAKKSQNKEATGVIKSDSTSLEPVMLLEESFHVAHSQKQTALRRSTRRSSIELSLSSNVKHSAVAPKGKKQISTCAESTEKKFSFSKGDDDDDDDDDDNENERLKEIYAKKPYVPVSPTRLETIYSPNKKRNDKNVFSKRKISRMLTFKPSETQLKNRQKKAMRNWPFLFMVPNADEKLNKLLNITEVKTKRK